MSDANELGPLAPLAGVWEGDQGTDVAPSEGRGVETNAFRERMVFDPIGRVRNHEQSLYGLRYATTAWRLGEADPFHEEVGYWLWDGGAGQVMRCFIVPRGVTVLAGGDAAVDARKLVMSAELGSPVFGIASNPFLDGHFRTVRYELAVTLDPDGSLHYEEDTQLQIPDQPEIFHHTDSNTLRKV